MPKKLLVSWHASKSDLGKRNDGATLVKDGTFVKTRYDADLDNQLVHFVRGRKSRSPRGARRRGNASVSWGRDELCHCDRTQRVVW